MITWSSTILKPLLPAKNDLNTLDEPPTEATASVTTRPVRPAVHEFFLVALFPATLLLSFMKLKKNDLLSRRHDRVKEVETETTIEESDHGTRFFDTHPR
jgi:hypothetical protein